MLQDFEIVKSRHQKFVKNICLTEQVYALKNEVGYAMSFANHFEDDEEEPLEVICFWSEPAMAKSCISEEWSDYQLATISLVEFIENWCVGMTIDGLIVGTEFDKNLFGFEIDPIDLILEIIAALKLINKQLVFRKYESIDDLEKQINNIV